MQPACSSDRSPNGKTPNSTREKLQEDLLLNLLYREGTWLPLPCSLATDRPPEEGAEVPGRSGTDRGLLGALWKEEERKVTLLVSGKLLYDLPPHLPIS
jgi:hypothetical protein